MGFVFGYCILEERVYFYFLESKREMALLAWHKVKIHTLKSNLTADIFFLSIDLGLFSAFLSEVRAAEKINSLEETRREFSLPRARRVSSCRGDFRARPRVRPLNYVNNEIH